MRQNASERPVKEPRDNKRSDDLLTNMMGWGLKKVNIKCLKKNVLGLDCWKE